MSSISCSKLCVPRLCDYHVSEKTGFLLEYPLTTLPEYFMPWVNIGKSVGDLVETGQLRLTVQKMPLLDASRLCGHRELRLANLLLSVITSGYIWQDGDSGVTQVVPSQLAVPMCHVADGLGLPVIATHSAVCNANWTLKDNKRPIELSNLSSVCLFPGGSHCSWFFLVTAMVELSALPGLLEIERSQHAVVVGERLVVMDSLDTITIAITTMKSYLARLFDNLSPDMFYNTVRPYLSGWGGNNSPAPDGIVFEGVSTTPKKAIGGSAAQSPPLQCFDALLNIEHSPERQDFLKCMREYMLPAHRQYIEAIRHGPSVRQFVKESADDGLTRSYNSAVTALINLRSYHIQLTTRYIVLPGSKKRSEQFEAVAKTGTGGTDLIPFLKSIRNSTKTFMMDTE